jgi:hypothetical protein
MDRRKYIRKRAKLHITGLYMRPWGAGSVKTQSVQAPLWVFTPPHFCGCWNTSCSFIATAKTSYTTGTLGNIVAKFMERNNEKNKI